MPKIKRVDVLDDLEFKGGAEGGREVEATEEREFAVGGKSYITYLCADNAKRFDEAMAEWTRYAEVVEATREQVAARKARSTAGGQARRDRAASAKIREWAQEQSFDPPVSERGRIPGNVLEAYYRTHPEERPAPVA